MESPAKKRKANNDSQTHGTHACRNQTQGPRTVTLFTFCRIAGGICEGASKWWALLIKSIISSFLPVGARSLHVPGILQQCLVCVDDVSQTSRVFLEPGLRGANDVRWSIFQQLAVHVPGPCPSRKISRRKVGKMKTSQETFLLQ